MDRVVLGGMRDEVGRMSWGVLDEGMRGLIRLGRIWVRRSEGEAGVGFEEEDDEEDDVDVDDDDPGVLEVECEVVNRLRCPWTNRVSVVLIRWVLEDDMMRGYTRCSSSRTAW